MKTIINKTDKASNLTDIGSVAELFAELDTVLADSKLTGLRNFNTAYLIITRNVHKRWLNNQFEHPDYLNQFDVHFASYYLNALGDFINHGHTVPAWQKVFERAEQNRLSPLKLMALGVNAHVNNDIPQVLRDTGAVNAYQNDFRRVNGIIKESIDEIIDSLDDRFGHLSPKRRLLKPVYKFVMTYLIKIWRQNAWYKFRKLQSSEVTKLTIENSANRMALVISRLPV